MATIAPPSPSLATFPVSSTGGPTWEMALLYPRQGDWSEEEYLDVARSSNRLIEFSHGHLEFLEMPNIKHQSLVKLLLRLLDDFVEARKLGLVLSSPLPMWTSEGKYREPDILFQFTENHQPWKGEYFHGADLVMEIVSADPKSVERDYELKRRDYAEGGIREYWIVDPQQQVITVLSLENGAYVELGKYRPGDQAASKLLPGFVVELASLFKVSEP